MRDFYVYQYIERATGVVRYVGKGVRDRAETHWRLARLGKPTSNKRFSEWLQSCVDTNVPPLIEVVAKNLLPSEAYIQEAELIRKYGRIGHDSQGTLFNHSPGFEYFNIRDEGERQQYFQKIDCMKHFNQKSYPEEMIQRACELYRAGKTQRAVQQILEQEFMKVTIKMLRRWWVDAGIHIRTKSEMRQGKLNPAFGRRGLVTKGFSGHRHTKEDREKAIETFRKTWERKRETD